MAFFEGLVSGFTEAAQRSRAESFAQQEAQSKREQNVLAELVKSDDAEIRNAAGSALLELAVGNRPKKGKSFLANLMGDPNVTVNPAVARVLDLARTPVKGGPGLPVTTGATMSFDTPPEKPIALPPPLGAVKPTNDGGSGAVPAGASAAMPPTAATQPGGGPTAGQLAGISGTPGENAPDRGPVGAPLPNTPAVRNAPPTPLPVVGTAGAPATPKFTGGQTTTTAGPPDRPRELFLGETEKLRRTTIAREQAEVEGEVAGLVAVGFTPEQAREEIKRKRLTGTASPFQSVAGEFTTPDGRKTPGFATFNRTTGQYLDGAGQVLTNFAPKHAQTGSAGSVDRNDIATRMFDGRRYDQLLPAEQQIVANEEIRLKALVAGSTATARTEATNTVNAGKPLTPNEKLQGEMEARNNFQRYVEMANRTVQQGRVIEIANAQLQQNLIDGAPVGAQSQALISAFQRMVDDLSSVRNEEYNRLPTQQGVLNRIEGWWTQVTQGGAGLAKQEVDNVVGLAQSLVEGRKEYIKQQADVTARAAEDRQLDPRNILPADVLTEIGWKAKVAPAGTGAPNTVTTPVTGGAPKTTLQPTPSAPATGLLLSTTTYPWYTADHDSGVRQAKILPGQDDVLITFGDGHQIVKFSDGQIVVLK